MEVCNLRVPLHPCKVLRDVRVTLYFSCFFVQATFAGEAKGAREATKQLGVQVKALGSEVLGSEDKVDSLLESLRMLERRQKEQHSAAAEAKSARHEAEQLREQVHGLRAAVSGSESKMATLLQAVRTLEARQQNQPSTGAEQAEGHVSRQQMQVGKGMVPGTAADARCSCAEYITTTIY